MTIEQIKAMVAGSNYDFLRTNEHLKDKLVFLTLGGSHAYGTNVETSDVDIRGCALNSKSDLLGLSNFEQVVNEATDTTIYSFNKLMMLLCNCNPNTIEMLGSKPEHYLYLSDIGKEMIDNRKMFLSKRAIHSFGGYANQQLRRLENALVRDRLSQARKEEHILKTLKHALHSFDGKYKNFNSNLISLNIDESLKDGFDKEVFVDLNISKFPARELVSVANDINNIISNYDKLGKRNRKKDDAHLNKHAMHLVRLYLMCIDILEKEEIVTYREDDHKLLMEIRAGKFQKVDHTYRTEFFELVNNLEERLEYAKENTALPKTPDMKRIEEFMMEVNRRSIR